MENILEVTNLSKNYESFSLNDISFSLKKGAILGLIGENGAGKSTTIKGILNLLNHTGGNVTIFGKKMDISEVEIKEDIGVILDEGFFSEIITPIDINHTLKHIYQNWDEVLFFQYLEQFKLSKEKSIKTLSSGMKMKLKIITALAHHPKLLILDEPTTGLDPIARNDVLEIFEDFVENQENAILLSTHITTDLERIADEIIFIENGSIVFDKTINQVKQYGIVKCDETTLSMLSKSDYLMYKVHRNDTEVLVENKEEFVQKYPSLPVLQASLEDIMVQYVRGVKNE